MNTSSPRPPDERFAEWVDGCMSQRDRERFEAELRVNASLRAELAAYERTVATLREALQAPTAPTSLADRVLLAVQAARPLAPSPSGPRARRSFGSYLFGGLAAAALMGVAVWFDAWVTPTGQADKVAQVESAAVDTPRPAAMPVDGIGGSVPHPETESAKDNAGDAGEAEARKLLGRAHDEVADRDKIDGADAKAKGGTDVEAEPVVAADGVPKPSARSLEPAGGGVPGHEAVGAAPAQAPAAPVASPAPVPVSAAEGGETSPGDRDRAKLEAVGAPRGEAGTGPIAPGGPAEGREAPPGSTGAPVVGSRGAAEKRRAPTSPILGPLPLLTVERQAPPPSGSAGTDRDELRARFAEGAQVDLPGLVDRFLAAAGAGAGDELVWRTPRGSLVLRAFDPALLAQPGERDVRRADSTGAGGGGGAPAAALPATSAWLIVGDAADIEILLARLGAKVRTEGWRLQTGEFEGPRTQPGPATSGAAGPSAPPTGAQRSLLLQFRFVR